MKYESNLPYPILKLEKNPDYAKLLLNSFAGKISEDTSIHLYLYQSIVLSPNYDDYKKSLMSIAITEMKHLKILGEAIKLLGLKPVYATIYNKNSFSFWSSSYLNYSLNLKTMLELDIKEEETAIRNYQSILSLIKDKCLHELLTKIIADEYVHLTIFKNLYQKYILN